MKEYESNFGIVELCLTYRCNVRCDNCSNLCTQAPFEGDLTAERVREFLLDSEESGHVWGMITLHGGEPVLNPEAMKIAEILSEYRKRTGCKLWLLTNNSSPAVRRAVTMINHRYDIPLGVSTKRGRNIDASGNPIEYVAVNESPSDLGIGHDLGCFQTANCGVCYNYLGYFPCSPMAAAARVFGYSPTATSFKGLTGEACREALALHCKHCGFSAQGRRRVVNQVTSLTWDALLLAYKHSINLEELTHAFVRA